MFLDVLTVLVERVRCIPAGGTVMDIHALRIICVILSYLNVVYFDRLLCNVFHSCDTHISVTIVEYNRSSSIIYRCIGAPLYFM